MDIAYIIILSAVVLYILIMIPFQYSYISAMREKQAKMPNQTQNDLYDNMSFEEQELHFNLQGSIITLPSSLIATLLYKIKHRK